MDDVSFGPFRLSRRRRELAGDLGLVAIGARAFDLLAVLLERPGRLYTKYELLELVWPGLVVEENNLHVQMVALRRALGVHHKLIQTVPGRGYRFAGEMAVTGGGAEVGERPVAVAGSRMRLPAELGVLVGRDRELAALSAGMAGCRLLTLAGPGGIGKTRLALALAHGVAPRFAGGVRLVDLAPLGNGGLMAGAVTAALGLRLPAGAEAPERANQALFEELATAIGAEPILLVLDNCEHLLIHAAQLATSLLKFCPAITLITTSQEPLRISGETIFRLDPLALPPPGAIANQLQTFGATALFTQRVQAADNRFQITAENSATIAEICRRLDGIPLAIEMAAARVPTLGIEGLATRLPQRLRILTTNSRTAATRHQTLRDTVTWSHSLLSRQDQAAFRRLGLFAGSFSATAATAILITEDTDEYGILDALSRLIEKSLLTTEPGEPPRYRLLETLRLFALEQLAETGEYQTYAARHATHFATLFTQAYDNWEATPDAVWLENITPDIDNARAALNWAFETQTAHNTAITLASTTALIWDKLALLTEGRQALDRAQSLITAITNPTDIARLYRQIGNFWHNSDRPRALAALERAESLYRNLNDQPNLGATLALIGPIRSFLGQTETATSALTEAKTILQTYSRPKSLINTTNSLGVIAAIAGNLTTAREHFEQALSITRQSNTRDGEILMLVNLAEIEFLLHNHQTAISLIQTAATSLRAANQQTDLGWTLTNLASYQLIANHQTDARQTAAEALSLVKTTGGFILRVCIQQWAYLIATENHPADAARLASFTDTAFESAGETRQPTEQRVRDDLQTILDKALAPQDLCRYAAQGAALSESQAAALAAYYAQQT